MENHNHLTTYMKLDVISKCKLRVIGASFFVVWLTFILIGVIHGPEVSKNNFTGLHSRCAHGFTSDMYASCQGNMGMKVDASGDLGATLRNIPHEQRQDYLHCLFDQCVSFKFESPWDTSHNGTLKQSHYYIPIDSMTQKHRYMYLEARFPNIWVDNIEPMHEFEVDAFVAAKAASVNEAGAINREKVVLDSTYERLHIICYQGNLYCEDVAILRLGRVEYPTYNVNVLFNLVTEGKYLPLQGTDTLFYIQFGNVAFTDWLIAFKILFVVLSAVNWLVFHVKLSAVPSEERHLEQNWIYALAVATVFFNDPFYGLETSHFVSDFWIMLSVFFQTGFFAFLFLFWLILLDNIYVQANDLRIHSSKFYGPKLIFISVFWLFTVLTYSYVKYQDDNDPVYDPSSTFSGYTFVKVVAILFVVIYFAWLIYLVVRNFREIRIMRGQFQFFLLLTVFIGFLSVLGLTLGAFHPVPPNASEWTGFYSLFNLYVMLLCYLYAPSSHILGVPKKAKAAGEAQAQALASEVVATAGVTLDLAELNKRDVA